MPLSAITLYDLNNLIKDVLYEGIPEYYWISAETSDVRENRSGHCYLEFIQKDESGANIVAKMRGAIWSNVYKMLKAYFEAETGQAFVSGIKVLVQVSVEFHEVYGLSLAVHNIDPSYTIGDQARNKALILKKLEEEGVIHLNKELDLPKVPNRIAVISSPTAAGYEDFCNQLNYNKQGYVIYVKLLPAVMQGDRTEESILYALDRINEHMDNFDAVVIIRGGGASSELSSFDSYWLATSVAQFPLPVITGIGHERDDTVLDIVAHTRVKTPTAAAEFLINTVMASEEKLLILQEGIINRTSQQLLEEKLQLDNLTTRLTFLAKERITRNSVKVEQLVYKLRDLTGNYVSRSKHRLEVLEQYFALASPENILKKGYTLTLKEGRILKSAKEIRKGDDISTVFADGEVKSTVK